MKKMKMAIKEEKIKKQKKERKSEIKTEMDIIKAHVEETLIDTSARSDMKKKQKKRKIATECMNDHVNDNAEAGVHKKKKKKKKLVEDEVQSEPVQTLVEEEIMKQKKREKKIKHKSCVEIVKIEKAENLQEEKKEAKKTKKVKQVTGTEIDKKQKTEEEDISVNEKETKQKPIKNKSKLPIDGVYIDLSESSQIQNIKMKKKKTKDKPLDKEDKEMHKVKKEPLNGESVKSEENYEKKKKRKKSKPENLTDDVVDSKKIRDKQFMNLDYSEPKKKKNLKESDNEARLLESQIEEVQTKKETGAHSRTKTKPKKIKDKRIEQEESSQMEVVFLSEKAGITDEVNINQERRQALQMEIDQESQPQKQTKGLGQWSTAEFGSCEQQQKFLRLMGGFKKGFQPASSSGSGSSSMALGQEGQQKLQQGLLGEFERAHSRRMDFNNRGAGLGFTAPSNKKFSIDVNATCSIRFDD